MKILLSALLSLFLISSANAQQPSWMQYGSSFDAIMQDVHNNGLKIENEFDSSLVFLYLEAAYVELKNFDYLDADRYVMKAQRILNRDYSIDNQAHYNLSNDDRAKFDSAKLRLQKVWDLGKAQYPELTAKAHMLYHCALLEAEETPRNCEKGFWDILGKIEYRLENN